MKYAAYDAPSHIALYDCDIPEIENPDDVLVKICYAGICDDDVPLYLRDDSLITWPLPAEMTGHEFSGIIEALGERALDNGFKKGDSVSGLAWEYCGVCENCRSGHENHCTNVKCTSVFSEYVIMSQRQLIVVPRDIDLKCATFTDPVSYCFYNLLKKIKNQKFSYILIFGINTMSLIMLQIIKKLGADRVVIVDPDYAKHDLAAKLGADETIPYHPQRFISEALGLSNHKGYDLIFEMSRDVSMLLPATQIIGVNGTILFSYSYGFRSDIDLSLMDLFLKEAELHPFFLAGNLLPNTAKMMQSLKLEPLISKIYPFGQIDEAFQAHLSGKHIKILIDFRR